MRRRQKEKEKEGELEKAKMECIILSFSIRGSIKDSRGLQGASRGFQGTFKRPSRVLQRA